MHRIFLYQYHICALLIVVASLLALTAWPPTTVWAASNQAEVPPGFAIETVVKGLTLPTDMVFLPSGDILVTEKGVGLESAGRSRVRLIRGGQLRAAPVLELSTSVPYDSGLLAIALDPNFVSNHYFYLWYATGEQAKSWAGEPKNRLSRFQYDPSSGTARVENESIILDNVPWEIIHAGGGLLFDDEGNLLLAMGDAFVFEDVPKQNLAQDLSSLTGKIVRIRPQATGYTIPESNPFVEQADVASEIYAYGLRNPFRMVRRADGAIFFTDVGLAAWEEVNLLQPGVNYGWPIREGPCPIGVRELPCRSAPPEFTEPVAAYPHPPNMGASITAIAFYEEAQFPAAYHGRLFYSDFNLGAISTIQFGPTGPVIEPFAMEVGVLVDMQPTAQGIYLLDIWRGQLQLLYYTEGENQAPVAQISATPSFGVPPLPVVLSAEGSYDPDDIGLFYEWDFGDGKQETTTEKTVTHYYRSDGVYQAQLTVRDVRNARSSPAEVEVTVYQGEWPKIDLIVVADNQRGLYRGGDEILYRATRLTGLQGLDPALPYRWDIEQLHNQHAHPLLVGYAGEIGRLEIPVENHDYEPTIRYRFKLTMRTETGQEIRVERELKPDLVEVRFDASPHPAQITVSQVVQKAGTTFWGVVGQTYGVEAAAEIVGDGMVRAFDHWTIMPTSSATLATPAAEPEIVRARTFRMRMPAHPVEVVAHYTPLRPALMQFLVFVALHAHMGSP